MIIFFGPAGAGKSVQGQLLAARNNWRWISAGQLLRDTHDIELLKEMQTGKLVSPEKINRLMGDALKRAKNIDRVILDGYPRQLSQAKWLIESQPEHQRSIALVVVLEVPRSELLKRIEVRGRVDDTPEAVDERLKIYRTEIYPILTYLTEQGVNIAHIDGTGSVGQVHDRIMDELEACNLA
ncbi:nucleoside monophosphate kinase [Streptomyces caniscabiei]|uniref:adenylate kinase family protein n=1 Tax=Streptomyces caniscabiei TaxID=2746961 RepID=UPI0029B6770E|nr:nucleoside monophosphate kinase [Streptomyces caniscabiei]MDX2776249.1 nucleoside monophosphate kinase [Streptomyces caniscabiei]